jgi:hypothetical protein
LIKSILFSGNLTYLIRHLFLNATKAWVLDRLYQRPLNVEDVFIFKGLSHTRIQMNQTRLELSKKNIKGVKLWNRFNLDFRLFIYRLITEKTVGEIIFKHKLWRNTFTKEWANRKLSWVRSSSSTQTANKQNNMEVI